MTQILISATKVKNSACYCRDASFRHGSMKANLPVYRSDPSFSTANVSQAFCEFPLASFRQVLLFLVGVLKKFKMFTFWFDLDHNSLVLFFILVYILCFRHPWRNKPCRVGLGEGCLLCSWTRQTWCRVQTETMTGWLSSSLLHVVGIIGSPCCCAYLSHLQLALFIQELKNVTFLLLPILLFKPSR